MIDAINEGLHAFWSQLTQDGVPILAYLSGQVPDDATYPYVTFEVVAGDFFSASILTAFVWCREEAGASVNRQRAALMGQVAQCIPESGTLCRLPDKAGALALYRNSVNFLDYFDDPTDHAVKGGRVSYQVNCYVK